MFPLFHLSTFQFFPKQCLHLGVLAELRAGRIYPPARASTATQNVEKNLQFLKIKKKRCWRSSSELGRSSFRRMLQLICLFLLQKSLGSLGALFGQAAPQEVPRQLPRLPFGLPLASLGCPLASLWTPRGFCLAHNGVPKGANVLRWGFQVLLKGLLMRSRGVPYGFQEPPKRS